MDDVDGLFMFEREKEMYDAQGLLRARIYHVLFWVEAGLIAGAFSWAAPVIRSSPLVPVLLFAAWIILCGVVILGIIPTWREMQGYAK